MPLVIKCDLLRAAFLGINGLRRSYFAMSSISPKLIPLIIKDIRFDNLLDPAYSATKLDPAYSATKRP